MNNKERVKAAVTSLLDEIKRTQPQTIDDIMQNSAQQVKTSNDTALKSHIIPDKIVTNSASGIAYELKSIDPNLCMRWRLANRQFIDKENCEELITNIKLIGQKIPAVVRKTKNEAYEYEIIVGSRRHFACKELHIPFLVAVADLDDKQACLLMDAENRPREDISPYERANDFDAWMHEHIYETRSEIMEATGIKKSLFSQIMALKELDGNIIKAFRHPSEISIRAGYEIYRLCKDSKNKEAIISEAIKMQNKQLSTRYVVSRFKYVCRRKSEATKTRYFYDKKTNKKMFTCYKTDSGLSKMIFEKGISDNMIDKLIENTLGILNEYEIIEKV